MDKLYFIGIDDIINPHIVAISTSAKETANYVYKDKKLFVRVFEVENDNKKGNLYKVILYPENELAFVEIANKEETLIYQKTDIATTIIVKARNEKKAIKKAKKFKIKYLDKREI